jgi:hypothetical protein
VPASQPLHLYDSRRSSPVSRKSGIPGGPSGRLFGTVKLQHLLQLDPHLCKFRSLIREPPMGSKTPTLRLKQSILHLGGTTQIQTKHMFLTRGTLVSMVHNKTEERPLFSYLQAHMQPKEIGTPILLLLLVQVLPLYLQDFITQSPNVIRIMIITTITVIQTRTVSPQPSMSDKSKRQ